jgi:uncharacterized membrane protein
MMDRALELVLMLRDTPLRVVHLLAFAAAIGTVVYGHVLLRDPAKAITEDQARQLRAVTTATAWALAVLVLSGFWRTIIGSMNDPYYWDNEKLVAKIGVVTLACVNGALMHVFIFPKMVAGVVPAQWPLGFQVKAALAAAISIAAWSWASLLGVARDWSYEATLVELSVGFIATVLLVYAVALREVLRTIVIQRQFSFSAGGRRGSVYIRLPHQRPVRGTRRQDRLEEQQQDTLNMAGTKEAVQINENPR